MLRWLLLPVLALAFLAAAAAPGVTPRVSRLSMAQLVPGAVLTQGYGCTALELEPVAEWCPGGHFHSGIDLAADLGTPVLAAATGLAATGFDPAGCGVYVLLQHDSFSASLYCHLRLALVAVGQLVVVGARLGEIGSSGLSTGPHLHFEVHREGRAVDPSSWLATAAVIEGGT